MFEIRSLKLVQGNYNYNVKANMQTRVVVGTDTEATRFITTVENARSIYAREMNNVKIDLTCNGITLNGELTKIYDGCEGITKINTSDRYLVYKLAITNIIQMLLKDYMDLLTVLVSKKILISLKVVYIMMSIANYL